LPSSATASNSISQNGFRPFFSIVSFPPVIDTTPLFDTCTR
jgi:hypothetical protein